MDGKKAREKATVLLCDVTRVVTSYPNLPNRRACTDNILARRVLRASVSAWTAVCAPASGTPLTMNETLSTWLRGATV